MEKTITFSKLQQAAIFEGILSGQIIDGFFWENSRPDYYKDICLANVRVGNTPGYKGFTPAKNYNFADQELIDLIDYRMIKFAKTAILLPSYSPQAIAYIVKYADEIIEACETHTVSDFIKISIKEYSIKLNDAKYALEKIDSVDYDEEDLKKDLNSIKKTLKK